MLYLKGLHYLKFKNRFFCIPFVKTQLLSIKLNVTWVTYISITRRDCVPYPTRLLIQCLDRTQELAFLTRSQKMLTLRVLDLILRSVDHVTFPAVSAHLTYVCECECVSLSLCECVYANTL
jgi:hypothetical protein